MLGLEDDTGKPVVKPPSILEKIGGRDALDGVIEIFYGESAAAEKLDGRWH